MGRRRRLTHGFEAQSSRLVSLIKVNDANGARHGIVTRSFSESMLQGVRDGAD